MIRLHRQLNNRMPSVAQCRQRRKNLTARCLGRRQFSTLLNFTHRKLLLTNYVGLLWHMLIISINVNICVCVLCLRRNNRQREAICFRVCRPAVVPLPINTYFIWLYISVLSGWILTNLGTNILHVTGHCWKGFQGQRSKVMVTARPVGSYISTMWCRSSLVYRGQL